MPIPEAMIINAPCPPVILEGEKITKATISPPNLQSPTIFSSFSQAALAAFFQALAFHFPFSKRSVFLFSCEKSAWSLRSKPF